MITSIIVCDTIDLPGIEPYTSLKRPHGHFEQGIFIVEGDKVVERFLNSELTLISILLTKELFDKYRIILEVRKEPVRVYIASKELVVKIVGFKYHQGVMAVGKIPVTLSINQVIPHKTSRSRLIVALDRIESAENTGVIVRNCAACGVQAIIVGETSTDPYLRRAVRNSMGNVFKVPVFRSGNLLESLIYLKESHGFKIICAHPRQESVQLYEENLRQDSCIVFGNEGSGISQQILSICDSELTIPMEPGVDSFNVACASAIVLYEVNRQRAMGS